MSVFPPLTPTTITRTLPAYLYQQYADDENLQAVFQAFNDLAQGYLDWFVTTPLPVYTSGKITGALLDWIAQGVYGISRPTLPYGRVVGEGLLNTFLVNQLEVNQFILTGVVQTFTTTDDIFKRIITWYFFKGDGQQFSLSWLKRRIMRFLLGSAGTAPNIQNTYAVGISCDGSHHITITITLTNAAGISLEIAQVFQAAIESGALALPFQTTAEVVIVNDLVATNLVNTGGVLHLVSTTGWPTSSVGLGVGALWSNSTAVNVIPGTTPDPFAAPVFFGVITSAQLLLLGGGNLPTSNPGVGSLQLWNDANVVKIA